MTRLEAERRREGGEIGDDLRRRPSSIEADEIDLVDGQHDMADAEQRDDVGVAAGLRQQALARIDQHDGEIGAGGAGRHIARILLVAGRVGDDESARCGVEK